MSDVATHVAPQNIEAEESVLGAMLVAEPTLARVIDEVKLGAHDFYLDRHRAIFDAIHDLYAASKPVDELSVSEVLTQHNKIDQVGGKHYVSELAAKVPAAGNATHYAEIVQQNSLLRRLLGAGQEIQGWVNERDGEPRELLHRTADLLEDLRNHEPDTRLRIESLAELLARTPEDVPTVGGRRLPRAETLAIAARGGIGKTTFLRTLLAHAAQGRPFAGFDFVRPARAVYFSGEGSGPLWTDFMRKVVEHLEVGTEAAERLTIVAGAGACGLQLTRRADLDEVRRVLSRLKESDGLDIACFDPFQRFAPGDENSSRDMGEAIGSILALNREFDIATIVPHHASQSGHGLDAFRGHTTFEGAIATGLILKSPEPGRALLEAVKVRYAQSEDDWRPIELTFDSQSTVYAEVADGSPASKITKLLALLVDGEWHRANDVADLLDIGRSAVRETYIDPAKLQGYVETSYGPRNALMIRQSRKGSS